MPGQPLPSEPRNRITTHRTGKGRPVETVAEYQRHSSRSVPAQGVLNSLAYYAGLLRGFSIVRKVALMPRAMHCSSIKNSRSREKQTQRQCQSRREWRTDKDFKETLQRFNILPRWLPFMKSRSELNIDVARYEKLVEQVKDDPRTPWLSITRGLVVPIANIICVPQAVYKLLCLVLVLHMTACVTHAHLCNQLYQHRSGFLQRHSERP